MAPSRYNRTPPGGGPWKVPIDPCNTEGTGARRSNIYGNCAYWAAEKRPDVWVYAVWRYGYQVAPGGAWNIELDAQRAAYPIDHSPRSGDLAVWPPNARMGVEEPGGRLTASPGGHVAYVERVKPGGTIVISEMGSGRAAAGAGGMTLPLVYDTRSTYFLPTP